MKKETESILQEFKKGTLTLDKAQRQLFVLFGVSKRYGDMEFAWISSATRLYPSWVNVELEKERFKEWFNSELGQNYMKNT